MSLNLGTAAGEACIDAKHNIIRKNGTFYIYALRSSQQVPERHGLYIRLLPLHRTCLFLCLICILVRNNFASQGRRRPV